MKKLYPTLLFIFSFSFCQAQNYVTIPDTAFVRWLQTNTVLSGCMNGNQLDTTCPAVLSKKTIDCSISNGGGDISDLTGIQYFKNLDTLICSNNPLTNLSNLPKGLIALTCDYTSLAGLPPLPTSLSLLECDYNSNLTTLPTLPSTLTYLLCYNDPELSNLPALPDSIGVIGCFYDNLSGLPNLPYALNSMDCSDNKLTSLPKLTLSINQLFCSGNLLTSLPDLINTQLYDFDCSYNQLTSLPLLPKTFPTINCSHNMITSIFANGTNNPYQGLDCSYNQLTFLPDSLSVDRLSCNNNNLTNLPPVFGTSLDCSFNQLTSLPLLSLGLVTLYCGNNQLTVLPVLPSSISELHCASNQLSSIPPLPLTMFGLEVDSNKLLTCLPPITTLSGYGDFNISSTGITCLTARISHPMVPSVLAIDTMPICGIFNPNGCNVFWNISGNTYFDAVGNCDTTITEPGMGKIKLLLYDSTGINLLQQVITNGDGSYSFNSGLGKYIVRADTAGTPFYVLCPDTNALHCSITAADSLDYGVNLRLACKNGYDVGVNSINYYGLPFFPGRSVPVNIQAGDFATYYGVTCNTAGLAGTVQAVITGPVTVSSASGNGIINGNTVTWAVTDFSQTNFTTAFNVVLNTNTSAQAGDQVCINVTVAANSGTDNNPSNNNLTQCFTVVASHDPNFKEVYPSNIANAGDWLTYTIHFQNTGSAPAQNIYVLDTIDNNLNISTIQVVATSNNALIQVLPGRIVRFSFPNIFLPDSLNNVDSSIGYIQYKIKTNSNIGAGTTIKNTASVYFDYNSPVQTNTATSGYDIATSNKELTIENGQLRIYPNPTSGIVNIILSKPYSNYVINVTDVLGRTILAPTSTLSTREGQGVRLNISGIAAGMYFIHFSNATQTSTVKVVKE